MNKQTRLSCACIFSSILLSLSSYAAMQENPNVDIRGTEQYTKEEFYNTAQEKIKNGLKHGTNPNAIAQQISQDLSAVPQEKQRQVQGYCLKNFASRKFQHISNQADGILYFDGERKGKHGILNIQNSPWAGLDMYELAKRYITVYCASKRKQPYPF